jgi:hypothetical protein
LGARKPQNSILVLATLGVYLGLVLAGATPQVLSQAAMTREFNVKDEIEATDKLDKKPDDERSPLTDSVEVYLADVESFLRSLERARTAGKFDLANDTFEVAQSTLLPCIDSNLAGRYSAEKFETSNREIAPALAGLSRKLVYGFSLGDCLQNSEFSAKAVDTRFNFQLNRDHLTIRVFIKKQSTFAADEIAKALDATFQLYRRPADTAVRQRVIDSTLVRTQASELLVSTHFPRADLDKLFAPDARVAASGPIL